MISIRQVLFISYAYFLQAIYFIYFMFGTLPQLENEPREIVKPYGEICRLRFKNSFADLLSLDVNCNIPDMFYDKTELQNALIEADNDLEKEWRRRVLFENTPRGNVIMYYDPYKLGFSYYCDQYLPYDILNTVAMKYVMTFKCYDFFMDELERPENNPSKLLKIRAGDEKKAVSNKPKSENTICDGPFAKLKTYNTVSAKVETSKNKDKEPVKDKQRNCFINLGKIMNFQFLQKPKPRHATNGFATDLIDGLSKNSNVQKEVFSYRDFKAAQAKLALN